MSARPFVPTLALVALLAAPSYATSHQEAEITSALLLSGQAEVGGKVEYRGATFEGTLASDGSFKVLAGGTLGPGEFAVAAGVGPDGVCVGAEYETDAATALRSGAVSAHSSQEGGSVAFTASVGAKLCVAFDVPIPLRPADSRNRDLQDTILVPVGKLLILPAVQPADASAPRGGGDGGGGAGGKPTVKVDADAGIEFAAEVDSFCRDEDLGTPMFGYVLDDREEAWALSAWLAEELVKNPELLVNLHDTRGSYYQSRSAYEASAVAFKDAHWNGAEEKRLQTLEDAYDRALAAAELALGDYEDVRTVIQDFVWRHEKLVLLNSKPSPEARLHTVDVKTTSTARSLLEELAWYSNIWAGAHEALLALEPAWRTAETPVVVRLHEFPEAVGFCHVVFPDKSAADEACGVLSTGRKLSARALVVPAPDDLVDPSKVSELALRHRDDPYLSEDSADLDADLAVTWLVPSSVERFGLAGMAEAAAKQLWPLGNQTSTETIEAALLEASAMSLRFSAVEGGGFTWTFAIFDLHGKETFSQAGTI